MDFVFGGEAACEEVLRGVDVESVLHTPEELGRRGWPGHGMGAALTKVKERGVREAWLCMW